MRTETDWFNLKREEIASYEYYKYLTKKNLYDSSLT